MAVGKLKIIGIGIIILSLILFVAIYTFTKNTIALNQELHKDCPLPEGVCPYRRSIPTESAVAFTVSILMFVSGLYLIASEREIEKASTEQKDRMMKLAKTLEGDDKKVYEFIVASDGFVFQNELIVKTGFSKVKVTRILDKLEGRGLIERRRRGMSNAIVLKH